MPSPSSSSITLAILSGMVVGGVVGAGVTATLLSKKKKNGDDEDYTEAGGSGGSGNNQSRSVAGASLFHKEVSQLATNVTNFDNITHVNFLSDIMARLWPYINQAGCDMMRSTLEPMFAEMMPGPFKSIKFTKLDLGEVPMVIDNIIVHQLKDNSVKFDWDITWDSSSDIQLSGNRGIINFGVKSIKLAGRMSFLLNPLSNVIPCIDAIQYAFVNPPHLELDFTGLANIADFSLVDKAIRQIMQDVLAGMMVLPIRKVYKMNPATNLWDLYKPLFGVARVTLLKGRGFQIEKRGLLKDDVPDVYCKMKLGAGNGRGDDDEWQTSTIKNSCNPDWTIDGSNKQSKDFLLADLDQILHIEAWDEDHGVRDSDDFLGRCKVGIGQILLAGSTMEVELAHKEKDGTYFKSTGCFVTISVVILPFTTDDFSSLQKPGRRTKLTHQVINPENELAGNLTVLISKAFNIPLPKKDAATFVKVMYGSETEIGVTGVVTDTPGYDAINPIYESSFHLPLKPLGTEGHKQLQPVKMQLINGEDTVLGEIAIQPDDLLKASNKGTIQESRKIGKGGASLEFYISLAGVKNNHGNESTRTSTTASPTAAATSVKDRSFNDNNETEESSNNTTTANASAAVSGLDMEQVQVSIIKGYGFEVKKTPFFKKDDIPDVYCVVKFGSNPQTWRTKTIKDCVAPVWNENKDYVLLSPNQPIQVGVFEANSKTKDDYYGNVRVAVGKVLLNGGSMDLEITHEGKKTGKFITVGCLKI